MAKTRIDELKSLINKEGIDFVDFKLIDLSGYWRHVTIHSSNFTEDVLSKGLGFDGSNYGYSSVQKSDLLLVPDLEAPVIVEDFAKAKRLSLCCDVYRIVDDEKERFFPSPRGTIKRAKNYLREKGIADRCQFSPEFEFYLFENFQFEYRNSSIALNISNNNLACGSDEEPTGTVSGPGAGYHAVPPSDKTADLRDMIVGFLESQGISTKYHHHETGVKGQAEVEVKFSDIVLASDLTMLIKYVIRNMAHEAGKSATLMPKPLPENPGNGMHLHQFLVEDGENIFAGSEYGGLSQTALNYTGGLLKHGKSLMAFTNPSTNSYRRLVPGHEAPTDLVYSRGNRSAAIRIPGYLQGESKRRIELRTMDGTCNPYLAYSAILMAGLDGIENEIDPAAHNFGPIDENIYELSPEERGKIKSTPDSLSDALLELEKDHGYLTKGDVFSEEQITNWIRTKREELMEFTDKPHPKEYELYYNI